MSGTPPARINRRRRSSVTSEESIPMGQNITTTAGNVTPPRNVRARPNTPPTTPPRVTTTTRREPPSLRERRIEVAQEDYREALQRARDEQIIEASLARQPTTPMSRRSNAPPAISPGRRRDTRSRTAQAFGEAFQEFQGNRPRANAIAGRRRNIFDR